jgi:hypothetical protein
MGNTSFLSTLVMFILAKTHYIAENESELKLNVIYRRLVYADNVDLKDINQDTRKKTKYSYVNKLQEKITTYRQKMNSQIHGSGYNKSKPRHKCKYVETKLTNGNGIPSRRYEYQKKIEECLPPFGTESDVFPFDIRKHKD